MKPKMNEEQLRDFLTSPFGLALKQEKLCDLAEIDKIILSRNRKLNSQHLEALNKTLLKLAAEIIVACT
jgi:hypothetical protein